MYNMLNKLKEFFILLFKLIIVAGAFYYIYNKIVDNGKISFEELAVQFNKAFSQHVFALFFLISLTLINWIFEIKKWQTLVSTIKKITYYDAAEQCLASLTAANITPNKVGDYLAKAAYFEKSEYEKIVLLNGVNHMLQLATTILFGMFGVVYMARHFDIEAPEIPEVPVLETALIVVFIIIALIVIKNFKWKKARRKLQEYKIILLRIPKQIWSKTSSYAILRYLSFSHQFYFLIYMFGIDIDYLTAMNLIFASYLISSFIPSISLFDWAVKGSVAVWAFSFVDVNELSILAITTIMWMFNYALPSLIGSVFVLRFKIKT